MAVVSTTKLKRPCCESFSHEKKRGLKVIEEVKETPAVVSSGGNGTPPRSDTAKVKIALSRWDFVWARLVRARTLVPMNNATVTGDDDTVIPALSVTSNMNDHIPGVLLVDV